MCSFISDLSNHQSLEKSIFCLYIIDIGEVGKASKTTLSKCTRLTTNNGTKWFIGDFNKGNLNKQGVHSKSLGKDYRLILFFSLIKRISSDRIAKTNQINVFLKNLINRIPKELFGSIESKGRFVAMYENEKRHKDYKNGSKMVSICEKWNDTSINQKACADSFIHSMISFCTKYSALGVKLNRFFIFSVTPHFRLASNKLYKPQFSKNVLRVKYVA